MVQQNINQPVIQIDHIYVNALTIAFKKKTHKKIHLYCYSTYVQEDNVVIIALHFGRIMISLKRKFPMKNELRDLTSYTS
jgi:hypothetical protein